MVLVTLKYGVIYGIRDPISKEVGGLALLFPPGVNIKFNIYIFFSLYLYFYIN